MTLQELAKELIGKHFTEAKSLIDNEKAQVRIRSFNGVAQMGTCDMQADRLNLTIEEGVVTNVSFG